MSKVGWILAIAVVAGGYLLWSGNVEGDVAVTEKGQANIEDAKVHGRDAYNTGLDKAAEGLGHLKMDDPPVVAATKDK